MEASIPSVSPTTATEPLRLLGIDRATGLLLVAALLNVMGYQVFVPILPLYLRQLGATSQFIGVVTGIGLLCYGVGQHPAGWLADRFDRRRVAIVATIAYAGFFLLYLLPMPLDVVVPVRLANAFAGGFFMPAALALLAELAPAGKVSRAYGMWQTTIMLGLLVGPLLGGFGAAYGLDVVFVAAAFLCLISAVPLLILTKPTGVAQADAKRAAPATTVSVSLWRRLLPAVGAAAAHEYLTGLLTAIWSIYVISHGGSTWEIGLTFTLFAVPAVAFSVWLGGIIDRRGARLVMLVALMGAGAIAPLYAFVSSIPLLIGLITLHGVFTAAERPVVYSEVVRVVPVEYQARAQGLVQMGLMVSQTMGAVVAGYLYAVSPRIVFPSIAVACALSLIAVPFLSGAAHGYRLRSSP